MLTSIARSRPVDADAHGRGLGRTSDQMQLRRREVYANPCREASEGPAPPPRAPKFHPVGTRSVWDCRDGRRRRLPRLVAATVRGPAAWDAGTRSRSRACQRGTGRHRPPDVRSRRRAQGRAGCEWRPRSPGHIPHPREPDESVHPGPAGRTTARRDCPMRRQVWNSLSCAMGKRTSNSRMALSTFGRSRSKPNSGVWMPMICRP